MLSLLLALAPALSPVAQDGASPEVLTRLEPPPMPRGATIRPPLRVGGVEPEVDLEAVLREALGQEASAEEAATRELDSAVVRVTVYPSSALVERTADRPAGSGELVLRGLPRALDPQSLRVRADGAEIVSIELEDRIDESAAPDERLAQLTAELEALRSRERELGDRHEIVEALEQHFRGLLSGKSEGDDGLSGPDRVEAMRALLPYVREQLETLSAEARDLSRERADLRARIDLLQSQIGGLRSGSGRPVRDLRLEVVDTSGEPGALAVEYVVNSARWEPYYDLRSSGDMTSVELVYRARVWQQSGEDWDGVQLALSTAEPRRGATGPEPYGVWLDVRERGQRYRGAADSAAPSAPRTEALRELGYSGGDDAEASNKGLASASDTWAGVLADGLQLRYAIPRPESILSRSEPTAVLVGRADLAVAPERYAVPARDLSVWVRGRTRNTSDWALLPGLASVYVGSEYLGTTALERVQPEAEFEVALGLDPRVTLERIQTEDERQQPGVFGSKVTDVDAWKVVATSTAGGPLTVLVHETLPRARDERIDVKLDHSNLKPLEGERWQKLQEEKGVLTFALQVPARGEATLEWRQKVAWPEVLDLVRN